MSFRSLLVQTVTVITPGLTDDGYGNEVPDYDAGTRADYPGRLDPVGAANVGAAVELIVNRDTAISLYRLFLPPEAVITPTSEVEVEGVTYEVQGEPNVVLGRRKPHHVEVYVRRTRG